MESDIQIAQKAQKLPIKNITDKLGIPYDFVIPYGHDKAKIDFTKIDKPRQGKVILVTSINPTQFGEGKSTTAIGLVDGLAKINQSVIGALREPSMGPVFGLKGGAAGGGYAQVVPMEDINLHFTGDLHAITAAHNLISAMLDNQLFHGNPLNIDPNNIIWPRALDMNDRALRNIKVCYNKKEKLWRDDHFVITVASEIMAVLCLSTSISDFKHRIEQIIVAYDVNQQPVTVKDLNAAGAVVAIMKDALKPNIVQTLEHNPVLIHGGPFANIAHGNNSIIATQLGQKLADYVVTEAGFGADLGAEKFFNIKCRQGDIAPSAVVIVVTVKALKLHGNVDVSDLKQPNTEAVITGLKNLEKHIETIQSFNAPFVIAINQFADDYPEELEAITDFCDQSHIVWSLCNAWKEGGNGAIDLAEKVVALAQYPIKINHTYALTDTIEQQLRQIVTSVYGGKDIAFTPKALEQLNFIKKQNFQDFAVCIAKTPLSLSDNPKLKGRPTDFTVTFTSFKVASGAKFIIALAGNVMTMPGLPKKPAAESIDVDDNNLITGLY